MHIAQMMGIILEHHTDGITDFRADQWAEYAEVLPTRRAGFQLRERRIRVFPVN
jgi:hypothetical protein